MKILHQKNMGTTRPNFVVQSNYSAEIDIWYFIFQPLHTGPFDVALFKIKWKC